ncbi:hypothetical protein ABE402_06040 [Bacillus smithii]|uniref:DUF6941 family protein n=1 Tax=Bacillus smithii TaxID=1479 RepID=UPI003D25ACFF
MARVESIVLSDDIKKDEETGQLNFIGVKNGLTFSEFPSKLSYKVNIFLTDLDANCPYTFIAFMENNKNETVFMSSYDFEAKKKPDFSTGLRTIITLHIDNQIFEIPGDYRFTFTVYKKGGSDPLHSHNIVVPVKEREV